jgi:gluconolactonase
MAAAQTPYGTLVRKDPRFDRLVPPGSVLEKLADGHVWSEGPVWNRKGGFLLFSDIPQNAIFQWKPEGGESLFLKPAGYTGSAPFTGREPGSNGLTYDAQGRLVLCEHGDRRVARLEANKTKTTLADRYEGKRLNSPNDLVYKSNGDLYFTDPPYGLPKAWDDPGKELAFQGVYRLGKEGKLTLLVKDLRAPNGIAFSPSEKTLYVAVSDPNHAVWMAYDVKADGTLGNGRVFFDATSWVKGRTGLPDGMKVDKAGNLFATGPGGIHVFAPDGTHLGSIEIAAATANLAFGGKDGSVLYITSSAAIYRVKTGTKGLGY